MSVGSAHLRIDSLNLRFGKFQLRDIDLVCEKGKYHILLGPSGSGKSSLVKCIMGFHKIDTGRIYLGGKDITEELPERRRMGYVPQNYGLFPHLNAEENIRFGMKANRIQKSEADALVDRLCGMLGIEALRRRNVRNLSGGEQQKVALARALGTKPETILLDEPFSSIDEGGKHGLWFELKHIIDEVGITAVHITHNLEEAETLGERLFVLIDGKLVQTGTRKEIFASPADENIARYLNYRNIFKGVTKNTPEGTHVEFGNFSIAIREKRTEGKTVTICIRQQDIKIIKRGLPIKDELRRNVFEGVTVKLFPLLDYCLMWFRIEGSDKEYDLELKFPRHIKERYGLEPGKAIQVAIWEPKIIVL